MAALLSSHPAAELKPPWRRDAKSRHHHAFPGQIMSSYQPPDFTKIDDSALLSMRAEMRAELERLPANSTARAALIRVYDASTEEVTERARKAWTRAK
jgi:hypothetical protein